MAGEINSEDSLASGEVVICPRGEGDKLIRREDDVKGTIQEREEKTGIRGDTNSKGRFRARAWNQVLP